MSTGEPEPVTRSATPPVPVPLPADLATPTWGHRRTLPARRPHVAIPFEFEGQRFTGGVGLDPDGHIAEIWISATKPNSGLDALASGAAICASLALQHGTPLQTIRHALRRNEAGEAACALGRLLDLIAEKAPG